MTKKIILYLELMRVNRPIGTLLLAYPVLWALWIAGNGMPQARIVFIFLLGVFITRSAGCVINDYADRNIDISVKRTLNRPITSGKVSPKEAIYLFMLLVSIAVSLLIWLPVGVIPYALLSFVLGVIYPFTKQFFVLPQFILGAAYSSSILMAFVAVSGSVSLVGFLIFIANIIWTILFDTYYAMVDRDDDLKLNINSSAIYFSNRLSMVIDVLIILFIVLMIIIGLVEGLRAYYYIGLVLAAFCLVYQREIAKQVDRESYFKAFMNNQWVGLLIYIGILISYLPI